MSKRFTDTEIWNDPWYRKLPLESKVLWKFLVDQCDIAGFWKKDFDLATFSCGIEISDKVVERLNEGKKRVHDHGEHFEIVQFVEFQQKTTELNPLNKAHQGIISLLGKYRSIKGYSIIQIVSLKGARKGLNSPTGNGIGNGNGNGNGKSNSVKKVFQKEAKTVTEVVSTKPEHSLTFLSKIPTEILTTLSEKYKIAEKGIEEKAYDLLLWCESGGKRKKNYKQFLETIIRKDKKQLQNQFPYIKPLAPPPRVEELSAEQVERNRKMQESIRETLYQKKKMAV